jgi:phage shock protein PspC (stress-responsive transcriptional regulator)
MPSDPDPDGLVAVWIVISLFIAVIIGIVLYAIRECRRPPSEGTSRR